MEEKKTEEVRRRALYIYINSTRNGRPVRRVGSTYFPCVRLLTLIVSGQNSSSKSHRRLSDLHTFNKCLFIPHLYCIHLYFNTFYIVKF